MNHFYASIDGWFDFQQVYSDAVRRAFNRSHFVEVGSWKGKSTAFMVVEIVNSGKVITFDAVDHWLGSEEIQGDCDVVSGTLFEKFLSNMRPASGLFNPIRLSSIEAAKLYAKDSLDFVFIDASHDYKNVLLDLQAWWPLVKLGGWMGGHDVAAPGVSRALSEFFGSTYTNVGCSWVIHKVTDNNWRGVCLAATI